MYDVMTMYCQRN